MDRSLTVLDCTLRDGGYYNNWDFPPELVRAYLDALSKTGVDVIEIGFRMTPKERFLGPFAFTTDSFIESLQMPAGIKVAVMINAADIFAYAGGQAAGIDALFQTRSLSPVAMVRIAVNADDALTCEPMVRRLRELGYEIGFNLMQASRKTAEELEDIALEVSRWNCVDVLYFADSLGNMDGDHVRMNAAALRAGWSGPLGIHTHDNMGQAFNNCLAAVDAGVTWLDATVLGMGRGAGNVALEYLTMELNRRHGTAYDCDALFPLVADMFEPLKERHRWGSNIFYFLSGSLGVHPTYVQQMLSNERYETGDVVAAIRHLAEHDGRAYSGTSLKNAVSQTYASADGSWSAVGKVAGRSVLLIAATEGARRHLPAIRRHIQTQKPFVVMLNETDFLPAAETDLYAACHPTRILNLANRHMKIEKPLMLPLGAVPDAVRSQLNASETLDFGMRVSDTELEVGATGCTVSAPLVVAYSIAFAIAGQADRILLAGFDGYDHGDPRHAETNGVFEMFFERYPELNLLAVTPTTYAIPQASIYDPHL